jgi:predicted Zn-dependent peptidase
VKTHGAALTLALLAALASPAAPLGAQWTATRDDRAQSTAIPDNPEKLVFTPIAYTPPVAKDYRVVLKNGMVVYIAEDPTLPLVNIDLTVRTGGYLDPAGKEGLAAFTGSQLRRGGSRTLSAEQLDERLDFLAANVTTNIGDTAGHATLNCLRDNLDESLAVFVEMLREPRFQEDRLALAKEQSLQEMKKRNDDSEDIEAREWNVLLYGEEHFTNRFSTASSVQAITRADLVDFHRKYFHPANMIAAVSGSFSRPVMIQKLEAAFVRWPWTAPTVPPIPSEIHTAAPGIYRIHKDVNQGRVSIGLPSVRRGDPDAYALEVMNEILGGSGFTSRIMKTVRSDEGLAYSAGSGLRFGIYFPGAFRAEFQSKSRTVAYATQLVLQEIKRIREAPVTAEELDTIKRNLIETFPSTFNSKAQTVAIFAADEYTRRDPTYWQTYRDRVRAVTAADVQRVAQKHLAPDKLVVLVVGDQKEIDLGDGKHQTSLEALAEGRKVVVLPLRDPLTMRRP